MTRHPLLAALALAALTTTAQARLPPPSDAQEVKAEETRAKAAWSDKVAAYQLCLSQNRTAVYYLRDMKARGNPAGTPAGLPPCADPGPFVPPAAPQGATAAAS